MVPALSALKVLFMDTMYMYIYTSMSGLFMGEQLVLQHKLEEDNTSDRKAGTMVKRTMWGACSLASGNAGDSYFTALSTRLMKCDHALHLCTHVIHTVHTDYMR